MSINPVGDRIDHLQQSVEEGFARTRATLTALTERIHAIELSCARVRCAADPATVEQLRDKLADIERWRWRMVGALAVALAVGGVAVSVLINVLMRGT